MWRDFYDRFLGRFRGAKALWQASEQNRIDRFFTFPNFERSAQRCGDELQQAGLSDVEVESFPANGKRAWWGWRSMKAWDVSSARLRMIEPRRELLCDWAECPHSLVMYSGPFTEKGELVEWNGELDVDLVGKIPFTRQRINDVYPQMRTLGASGIVSDSLGTLPGVRDPFDLPDDVRWENSGLRPAEGACWGFMLTPRQGAMLRERLRAGRVRLRVEIQSRLYDGVFKCATGLIRGCELPEEEILFVTHLYEPGGNDNASGVGVGLEIARALGEAIEDGTIRRPRRSIRFLFNWEGYGLYAWLYKHSDQISKLLCGLNIDEIGVDQTKGRSVLHLFMPPAANPSCAGHLAAHLCGELLAPTIRWKAVADRAEIINDTISSDPNLDIPLPCLIQYPSRAYHSSADKIEMLNPDTMAKIGNLCATHLYSLADAGPAEAEWLGRLVAAHGEAQLRRTELELLSGSWPFGRDRTVNWFQEQAVLSVSSIARLGLSAEEVEALQQEMTRSIDDWAAKWEGRFREEPARTGSRRDIERAAGLVMARTTTGSPKAWGSVEMMPEEEAEYRRVLYENNLDLLFHRILYWADGKRSLLDTIVRLEIELKELLGDSSISRTSSGFSIAGDATPELDVVAVLHVADKIIGGGYLEVVS